MWQSDMVPGDVGEAGVSVGVGVEDVGGTRVGGVGEAKLELGDGVEREA